MSVGAGDETVVGGSEKLAGVSSQAVAKATGRTWAEWLAVLDAAGAQGMSHPEIVAYLTEQQGVGEWWRQMVTVGYEQARGLRQVHEKTDGFTANASKTLPVGVDRLFEAWADDGLRERWLPGAPLTIRKATPGKSLRIAWDDGSSVDANLAAKGENKSQVAVQHSKLPDAASAAEMKAYWVAALERLKVLLSA
jgi:uncharacterized protein YndB with AHSA1/START domain